MTDYTFGSFDPPPRVTVRRDRRGSLDARHPWLFAGQLAHPPKNLPAGVVVEVVDEKQAFLAWGAFNDASNIAVRVLGWDATPKIDADLLAARVRAAVERRRSVLAAGDTDACRLIFGEADRLPGLVVDKYGDWLVVQFLAAALEPWRGVVVETLAAALAPRGLFERSDSEERRAHEGLLPQVGVLWGEEPPAQVLMREHGLTFAVDLRDGHKTGFYLDQRDNRAALARYCDGASVLNAFAYSGGFGVYAAASGAASVLHIDSSGPALDLARANAARNPGAAAHEFCKENVFDALRRLRGEGRQFDVIVLDPPKFAASRGQLERATRGYRDLNAAALRLLAPGGVLASFSCSGAMDRGTFYRTLAQAAVDARRDLQLVEELGQPFDHPILLSFPEGVYLKGAVLRAV